MTEPAKPFAHLDAPNVALYRGVMGVFVAAKRRFLVHLRPEDVLETLRGRNGPPVEATAAEAALKRLESWRNLRADPDTSRVTTVDDFYRPRYLHQFTPEGEAAELALAAYDEALGNRVSPDGPEHFPVVFAKTLWMLATEPELDLASLAVVGAPTLVLQGDRDEVTLEHGAAIASALPQGRLAVLPGTHLLPVEAREVVNALLLWFLAGATPAVDWQVKERT